MLIVKAKDFALLELIQFLGQLRRSGELIVEDGDHNARFLVHEGRLMGGWHGGAAPIGQMLLDREDVTEEILNEALRMQAAQTPRRPLGQILLESGGVDRDALEEVLSQQIKSALYGAMSWEAATIQFNVREMTPADDFMLSLNVNLRTQEIIFDIIRAQDEVKRYMNSSSSDLPS